MLMLRSKKGTLLNQRKYALELISHIGLSDRPKQSHLEATFRVVQYIKGYPGLGVLLTTGSITNLSSYCDSEWASCPNTKRSVTGYVVKLREALISWKSKKQHTVRRSSTKAEYWSMVAVVAEVTWVVGLLQELGFTISQPMSLFCDNKAAI
ncbi:uncharacterized mitochondrial protein AtMg00810-like [Nicotiana sylvestris]|uniref:uncharacterized mitochondrial protein AtMg00810-like n=1 Tax=Nicotiana sylvestris TaxID=4096 RepID=UPI00388CD08F